LGSSIAEKICFIFADFLDLTYLAYYKLLMILQERVMLFRYRLPAIFAGLSVLAVSVFASVDWLLIKQNEQDRPLKVSQQALAMTENPVNYRLLPESMMTGICWRSADGSRQGVFKDITDGIMQWRETAPSLHGHKSAATKPNQVEHLPDKQQLLRQLKHISFQPADFVLTDQTAKVSGVLTVAKASRHIILDLDRPSHRKLAPRDKIEVTASTAINRYLPVQDLYTQQYHIDLCLHMQAVSNSTNTVLALDLP
jgi:hypothetical protein